MTDIVKRLRANDAEIYLPLLGEAADYIERLREALELIRDPDNVYYAAEMRAFARAALGEAK